MDISNLEPQRLRKAADLQEKILALQQQVKELLGEAGAETAAPAVSAKEASPGKRKLSRQGVANIRAGVAKRIARQGNAAPAAGPNGKPKRKISAAGRKALSVAAKARWAKVKASGQNKL